MGDIAKGVLGGGWALVVGWVLPAALNLAVFLFAVAPSLRGLDPVDRFWPGSRSDLALLLLVGAVLLGLVLNALQTLLYRFLEGYVLWPRRAYAYGCAVQLERRRRIARRIGEAPGTRLSPIQLSVMREQLSRYPIRDEQVGPTRLANALRRFEEYGYDRYRLDTQVLWHELTAVAPGPAARQAETSRTSVDFFVALLYGHVGVAAAAVATAAAGPAAAGGDRALLVATGVLLAALVPVWYRCAVVATDEWAAAVQALVNLGRKPLADALGLVLPQGLAEERAMWHLVTRLSQSAYGPEADAALAPFRAEPAAGCPPCVRDGQPAPGGGPAGPSGL